MSQCYIFSLLVGILLVSLVDCRGFSLRAPDKMSVEEQAIIEDLGLLPHPEGGYFKEAYRAEGSIPASVLSASGFTGSRSYSTAIYYMLGKGSYSSFHKIKSDELWHHYHGCATSIYYIQDDAANASSNISSGDCDGRLAKFDVGFDVKNHVFPLATVPKGVWFAAEPDPDCEAYSLMGATVAPGFNYTDWSIATKPQLIEALGGEGNVCDEYMKVVDRLVAKDLEETDR